MLGMVRGRNFSGSVGKAMLSHMKTMFDKGYVAVHPSFSDLVVSLRSAYSEDGDTLSKQHSPHNDIFEALMISLYWWRLQATR